MVEQARVVTFSMTSEPQELARMRAWLLAALADANVSRDRRSALVLAAGELCANAIKHAYGNRPGQPIHLTVRADADRVVIEVENFGEPFDPSRYTEPDLDRVPDHGLGLYLVKSIADHVAVDVGRERGTRWILTAYRAGSSPSRTEE